ncbi:hypothetical protein BTR23_10050 [Alkalihalophilus pseudofirmus]|nr:hypothetical protein BTR23_10050 [Alkalihalophilus pseudofirmus]
MSIQNEEQEESKRGRPLDLSRSKVILTATLELLADNGYDALTIDAVAAKAKVGKATIYRRWASKIELVLDAATSISPFEKLEEKLNKDQGLRGQLVDMLSFIFQCDNKKYQKAMTAIHSGASSHEKLEKALKNDFYRRHRNAIESVVKPFLRKNHTLKEYELDLLADIGPALITYRNLFIGKPFDRAYVEQIVDTLMMPMIKSALKVKIT